VHSQDALELGTVSSIWRYPVKSLRGEPLENVPVDERGLDGDRRRELVLATPDLARSGKSYRGKEDNRLHLLRKTADAEAAAEQRGMQLETRDGGPFFDAAPISIIAAGWLREFERLAEASLDPRRFRPNFFLASSDDIPAEGALVGATIALGSSLLLVKAPIVRCVTITYDVDTGVSNPELLRILAQRRDTVMGIYCTILRAGTIEVGARATVCAFPPALSTT